MIEIRQTGAFASWLSGLRDLRGRARIFARIDRIKSGNFGDAKFFDGIGELRIDHGPGYRIYFVRRGQTAVMLLCGGGKSTQDRDIRDAIAMAKEV